MAQVPFHLAFPVSDLEATRNFFTDVLGCATGRSSDRWIDFDFFGHQVVAHLADAELTLRQPTRLTVNKSRRATSG